MSQDNDKRDLLKLKQGLIEESDAIDTGGYDVKMPETAAEKTKNWMWYHTGMIILGALIIIVGIICYLVLFKKEPRDLTVYSVNNYALSIIENLEVNMSRFCPDFDNDGKGNVKIEMAVRDKVLGNIEMYEEVLNGDAEIYIGTRDQITGIYEDVKKAKGQEIFCSLDGVEEAEGYMVDITKTAFGKALKMFTSDLFIAVKQGERSAEGIEFVSNIVSGKSFG